MKDDKSGIGLQAVARIQVYQKTEQAFGDSRSSLLFRKISLSKIRLGVRKMTSMFLDKPEEIVKDYLEKNHFLVKKIDEKIVGQKPDFEVFLNNDLVFYCEVKSLRGDLDINKMIESEEPNEPISRHDPIFNSIANRIHEASKQFLAVNPKHNIPNVLSFVNKYFIPQSIGIDDLFLTLYGYKTGDKLISYIKKKLEKDYMRVWK